MRRWSAVIAAVCALPCGAATAGADEPVVRVALEWQRGPRARDCATGEALRRAAAPHLRHNLLVGDGADAGVIVRGRSERLSDAAWRATIRVIDRDDRELGRRELTRTGRDCAALDRALVVVLAMIVDSSLVAPSEPAAEPPGRDAPAISETPTDEPAVDATVAAPATPGWRGAVVLAGQVEIGRLPGVPAGIDAAVRAEPPRGWPIELGVSGWTRSEASLGAAGSRFRHASAGLMVCPHAWTAGRLALDPCVGTSAGVIAAEGFGFLDNRRRRAWIVDARLELRAEVAIRGPWFVRTAAGVAVALTRPAFSYESETGALETFYQPEIAAGLVRIGAGARFW